MWHSFGAKKKSTKQLYEEMKRLEKKDKDETEKKLIQQRVDELKHKKRNERLSKIYSSLGKAGSFIGKETVAGARLGYKEFEKYEHTKHRRHRRRRRKSY
jgi:hypothetical protein